MISKEENIMAKVLEKIAKALYEGDADEVMELVEKALDDEIAASDILHLEWECTFYRGFSKAKRSLAQPSANPWAGRMWHCQKWMMPLG